jgi:hypothetical protein
MDTQPLHAGADIVDQLPALSTRDSSNEKPGATQTPSTPQDSYWKLGTPGKTVSAPDGAISEAPTAELRMHSSVPRVSQPLMLRLCPSDDWLDRDATSLPLGTWIRCIFKPSDELRQQ